MKGRRWKAASERTCVGFDSRTFDLLLCGYVRDSQFRQNMGFCGEVERRSGDNYRKNCSLAFAPNCSFNRATCTPDFSELPVARNETGRGNELRPVSSWRAHKGGTRLRGRAFASPKESPGFRGRITPKMRKKIAIGLKYAREKPRLSRISGKHRRSRDKYTRGRRHSPGISQRSGGIPASRGRLRQGRGATRADGRDPTRPRPWGPRT
mgnify:CR=1 FL=1